MRDYRARKRELLATLSGTVLEIGAGRGALFDRLPARVTWLGVEPARDRQPALVRAAHRYGRRPWVLDARAEALPLPDASVDAVVAGAVLCSVADPARVLAEVRRVLRHSGTFVFFEHVAAPPGTWSRRLQGMCAPFTRRFDHGCDPTRATAAAIEAAGFAAVDLRCYAPSGRPTVYGMRIAGTAAR